MVCCHESTYKDFFFFFLSWLSAGLCAPRYFDTNAYNDKEGFFYERLYLIQKIFLKSALVRLLFLVVRY